VIIVQEISDGLIIHDNNWLACSVLEQGRIFLDQAQKSVAWIGVNQQVAARIFLVEQYWMQW
jgi:hypothetical protein